MVVHWEQLDERERKDWLALVSEASLAEHRRTLSRLEEIDRELRRFRTILRPWRLVSGAFGKLRLTIGLTSFIRRIRSYERSLAARYDPARPAGGTQRVILIGFAGREELRELEWRASRQVRTAVDEMINAG